MSEENQITPEQKKAAEEKAAKEKAAKEALGMKYKSKGAQTLTLKEHLALKAKKAQSPKANLHPAIKLLLSTPLILLACFGIFFIPYMLFQIFTGKPEKPEEKTQKSSDLIFKKTPR